MGCIDVGVYVEYIIFINQMFEFRTDVMNMAEMGKNENFLFIITI